MVSQARRILDTVEPSCPDFYLVLAGPKSSASTSSGGIRPWCVDNVYLFGAKALAADRADRGQKAGVASSVRNELWSAAEIFPQRTGRVVLTEAQRLILGQFSSAVL
ncbi:hypothetical protein SAMN04515671_2844 [Nakamurella panacisegetis]|uniref:Uncharacterized protein n=1 Tax=Nakamurella panacisegetis TaxID=1090615 RepID=A0A1H0PMF3_9ACTN|nr:hypothetical protein [Nakamurella panacisegetis]SDP06292.1 hypothetical protein SAMN04515671_2844 [Nakamurella panacisegetis]